MLIGAVLAVVAATWACVGPSAPEPINHAIQVIARHLPAYEAEANRVLAESDHLDRNRLIGTGERLDGVGQETACLMPVVTEPVFL